MNDLIPDREKELDDIARRIVIMWIENPDLDMKGLLFSLKSRVNRICNSVAEWSGDGGKLWREDINMCNWSQENGKCPQLQQGKAVIKDDKKRKNV